MGNQQHIIIGFQKKSIETDRPLTVGLLLLRCIQIGIPLADLDLLDLGMIIDILKESENDDAEWYQLPTQADFDRF